MLAINNELDDIASFIAVEQDEHVQRSLIHKNMRRLIGLITLKNVEEYGNQADYDALIQNDYNGELLRLLGLYMSAPNQSIANDYAKLVLTHLTNLLTVYWKREAEDVIEEKINNYKNRNTEEDDAYEMYKYKAA